jgi:AraC-like DNA-binding protein
MSHASVYCTQTVNGRDRFAFWSEAVCNSFVQLGCETTKRSGFTGRLETVQHSCISVAHVSGSSHRVERRKRDIRATSEAYFLLSLQRQKTARISQFGNVSLLQAGDMAIYDSTHPYVLELSEDFTQTVLQLPRQRLLSRLPNAEMMGGLRIDGQTGIGKLVGQSILAFAEQMREGNQVLDRLLQDTLIDLVATGLASVVGSSADLSSPERHVLMRARSFIAAHLGDPDLDRNRVAAELGMSLRRLNDIFAKDGLSIAHEIRNARLSSVARDLIDPRFAGLTISEIAMKNGLWNLQHFSTLFRTAYGQSPKSYRAVSHREAQKLSEPQNDQYGYRD